MTALSFALSLLGFLALAMTLDRHQDQFLPSWKGWSPRALQIARLCLRAVGFLLLGIALACVSADLGWGNGSILWLGLLTPAALMVAAGLSCWPGKTRKKTPAA